jgi:hypothetical protein
MLFTLKVMSRSGYETWLANAKATAGADTSNMITTYTGGGPSSFEGGPNTQRSHQ